MKKQNNFINQGSKIIDVIGIDAYGLEKLSPSLIKIITSAEAIAGPERILELLPNWWTQRKLTKSLPNLIQSEKTNNLISLLQKQSSKTVVLASGDPLWFGIGRLLLENFSPNELSFHPSPTSLQLAFSRIGRTWQDSSWISIHGRDPYPLAEKLQQRPDALTILPDQNRGGAKEIQIFLRASGLEQDYSFWIFEQLGHPEERIQRIFPGNKIDNELNPLHIVVLIKEKPQSLKESEIPLFGIEDGIFFQYKDRPGLMTKREVRVQILAELELKGEGIVWDIGAGIGTIGLEALRINPKLKLIAVDKRIGSKELIKKNSDLLGVKPELIIESDALSILTKNILPKRLMNPDRVILGGGGSERVSLLKKILSHLNPEGVVVIPLSTIQGLGEIEKVLNSENCYFKVSQHQSYRGVPLAEGTRLSPINPVFIVKAKLS